MNKKWHNSEGCFGRCWSWTTTMDEEHLMLITFNFSVSIRYFKILNIKALH